jgi:hypothetical protein
VYSFFLKVGEFKLCQRKALEAREKPGNKNSPAFETRASGFLSRVFRQDDRNVTAAFETAVEFDHAVAQGEEGVIFAKTDKLAGVVFSAALADDDATLQDLLAAVFFHAKSLTC